MYNAQYTAIPPNRQLFQSGFKAIFAANLARIEAFDLTLVGCLARLESVT
jgi:hypothetical protein